MQIGKTTHNLHAKGGSLKRIDFEMRSIKRAGSILTQVLLIVLLFVMAILFAGFFRFYLEINRLSLKALPLKADGIVVLTGDVDRIETGLELLEAGKAGRLLISGVHGSTSKKAILAVNGRADTSGPCCIDIGHLAKNTIGNATEIASWARVNRFSHLIVVTSDYHLPRSMFELEVVMPDIELSPYAPRNEVTGSAALRLLLREYGKYLIARVRVVLIDTNSLTSSLSINGA